MCWLISLILIASDRGELSVGVSKPMAGGTSAGSETSASVTSSPATHQAPSPAVPSPDVAASATTGAVSEPRK